MRIILVLNYLVFLYFNLKISVECNERIICYYPSLLVNDASGDGFSPEDIDTNLCTDIMYSRAVLDKQTLLIRASTDPKTNDYNTRKYKKITDLKLKNPELRVILSMGDYDTDSEKYSRLISNKKSRNDFKEDVTNYLRKYNFDGLNIDWQYPKCQQKDCDSGPDSEKESFGEFLSEIKRSFYTEYSKGNSQKRQLILTASLAHDENVIYNAYDVDRISYALDYLILTTHKFNDPRIQKQNTAHIAPFDTPNKSKPSLVRTLKIWDSWHVEMKKIIITVPSTGATWTLKNSSDFKIGAEAIGSGRISNSFLGSGQETPLLSYFQICEIIQKRGWNSSRDQLEGSYSYNGNQWVSYDDPVSMQKKALFVKQKNLAGIMLVDVTQDDFKGVCGQKFPLLNAINRVFRPDFYTTTTITTTTTTTTTMAPTNATTESTTKTTTMVTTEATTREKTKTTTSTTSTSSTPTPTTSEPTTTTLAINLAIESKLSSALTLTLVLILLLFIVVVIIGVGFFIVSRRSRRKLPKRKISSSCKTKTGCELYSDVEERYIPDHYDSIQMDEANTNRGNYDVNRFNLI